MININNQLSFFIKMATLHRHLLPSHISLYSALLLTYQKSGFANPFRITRRELMKLSSIRSYTTYHKRLEELIDLGCLIYSPSFDPILASQIELLPIIATATYGNMVDRHIAESPFS
jgi:hypothetical protein